MLANYSPWVDSETLGRHWQGIDDLHSFFCVTEQKTLIKAIRMKLEKLKSRICDYRYKRLNRSPYSICHVIIIFPRGCLKYTRYPFEISFRPTWLTYCFVLFCFAMAFEIYFVCKMTDHSYANMTVWKIKTVMAQEYNIFRNLIRVVTKLVITVLAVDTSAATKSTTPERR